MDDHHMTEIERFFRDESRHPSEWEPAVAKGCPLPECDFNMTVQWRKRATLEIVDVPAEVVEMMAREHIGGHTAEDVVRIFDIREGRE